MRLACALLAFASLTTCIAQADMREGMRYLGRGQPDYAYREFKAGAEEGDVLSARMLGRLLERGVEVRGGYGLKANREEAEKWYRKAVEGGDVTSAELLAVLLAGRGHEGDFEEALRFFAIAGRTMDPEGEFLAKYPRDDRPAIAAWVMGIRSTLAREAKYPRESRRGNNWGEVVIEIAAERRTATVVSTDAAQALLDAAEAAGRAALNIVPPSLAVTREKVVLRHTLDFRLK